MINQEYLPCNRQIHIKISDEELKMIRDRMEQMGFKNMSAYIRKMAIDGYCINVDFTAIHELAKMMCVDSRNINQIAKAELNGVEITPEMINCSGCRIPGVKTVYCDSLCPIRQCAREKQLETCGGCPEMRSCEKVGAIIGSNPSLGC